MRPTVLRFGKSCRHSWAVPKRSSSGSARSSRANWAEASAMPVAVLHAAQLVTVAGPKGPRIRNQMRELAIILDGGMLVEDGRVVATGTSSDIEKALPVDAEIVEARGKVVLPGFVDAHTHPVFGGNRVDEFERRADGATYEQIAESGGGIRSTVRRTRAASEEELLAKAKKHATWF